MEKIRKGPDPKKDEENKNKYNGNRMKRKKTGYGDKRELEREF